MSPHVPKDLATRTAAPGRPTRRGLLAAAVAAAGAGGLAGCTVARSPGGAAPSPGPAADPTVTVTATSTATQTVEAAAPSVPPEASLVEEVEPWLVPAGEVLPEVKQATADFLTAVMSFDDRGPYPDELARRLEPTGQPAEVARPLTGLLPVEGPSALQIRYAQYGGLNDDEDRASQIVMGEQLLLNEAGELVRRPFGADVRLGLDGDRWVVTAVVPAYPDPPLPPLPDAIEELLEDPRVELPGIAAADLRSGVVHESVAVALLALAERWRIGVHDFYSGHPFNVFATTRPSLHTVGRAVDVTTLDGIPVIARDEAPWRAFMEAARVQPATTDIGGPQVPAPGQGFFTDLVHQDHVHIGFALPPDRRV